MCHPLPPLLERQSSPGGNDELTKGALMAILFVCQTGTMTPVFEDS